MMCGSPFEKQMSDSGSESVGASVVGMAVGKAVGADVHEQHWAPWLPVEVHDV
jgi:hypothetical protein